MAWSSGRPSPTWSATQSMVGDDYGIRWLPTYVEANAPEARQIATFPPVNRMLTAIEHPFPLDSVLLYDTMYVETGRYLRQMMRDVHVASGKIEVRRFAAAADIAALPEALVFNCTGLGSRELFGDTELQPIRGQLAILEPQPEVRYAITGGPGYMIQAAPAAEPSGTAAFLIQMFPLLAIFVIFYVLMIRPQQRRVKEHQAAITAIKKGDEIITGGGIRGKVTRVMDDDAEVEIAQGVKVRVVKSTITGVATGSSKPAND